MWGREKKNCVLIVTQGATFNSAGTQISMIPYISFFANRSIFSFCYFVNRTVTSMHLLYLLYIIVSSVRRGGPTLYDVDSKFPVCVFSDSQFQNSCTMKSCSFIGNYDEFVVCPQTSFPSFFVTIVSG